MALPPVLVVDDDSDIRQAVRFILEDEGYLVYEAAEGEEGLAYLQTISEPTIAIVSIVMPRMDGWEMLRRVEADARLASRHRYLVMTGLLYSNFGDENQRRLIRLDAPYLPKPFNMEDLLDAVGQASAKLSG